MNTTKYYKNGDISLTGFDKTTYVENMLNWCNSDSATHYLVTGLKPVNQDLLEEEYNTLIRGKNVLFAIEFKDTVIGSCGLYSFNWQARHAELRILIGESTLHGKGIVRCVRGFLLPMPLKK